jgi:hypothetical protein
MEDLLVIKKTLQEYESLPTVEDESMLDDLKNSLKAFTKMVSELTRNPKVHSLFVKNFDCEQIWDQLVTNDAAMLKNLTKDQRQIVAQRESLKFETSKPKATKKVQFESQHDSDLQEDDLDGEDLEGEDLEGYPDEEEKEEVSGEDESNVDMDDMNKFLGEAEEEDWKMNAPEGEGGEEDMYAEEKDSDDEDLDDLDPDGDLAGLKGGFEDLGDDDFADIEGWFLGI